MSGDRGTAWYHDQKWRTFASTDGSSSGVRRRLRRIGRWQDLVRTTQDKVWAFDGRNWSVVRAGLDRINALIAARDGSLWVGTDSGLHRFFQGAWVENGTEEGLPGGGVRELCEDPRGRIWAGTAHGLSLYHPEADPDPPRTYVQMLGEQGEEHSRRRHHHPHLQRTGQMELHAAPTAALLLSPRAGATGRPFQEERTVSFTDLPAGKHDLQVRAMDRNCNIDPTPGPL